MRKSVLVALSLMTILSVSMLVRRMETTQAKYATPSSEMEQDQEDQSGPGQEREPPWGAVSAGSLAAEMARQSR